MGNTFPLYEYDLESVLDFLQYRHPAILLDRIETCEPKKYLSAVKNVTRNEVVFLGQRANTFFPASLVLEAIIQAATILAVYPTAAKECNASRTVVSGIKNVEFFESVVAGDQLKIEISGKVCKPYLWLMEASVTTDTKNIANAMISLRPFHNQHEQLDKIVQVG